MAGTVIIPETLTGYATKIQDVNKISLALKGAQKRMKISHVNAVRTLAIFTREKDVVLAFLADGGFGHGRQVDGGDCRAVGGIGERRHAI